jgi:transmembrane sensor
VAANASAAPQPVRVTPTQITQSLAWRNKRIEFTETPLADVLELFNRANTLRLQTADAATGQLEVSGIFWADDPETFVRLIEAGLDLRSERAGDRVTLRQK